jgi:hypothetical protein
MQKTNYGFRVEGLSDEDHQDWFIAREMIMGDIWLTRVPLFDEGMALARKCKHPEALWLVSVLKDESSIQIFDRSVHEEEVDMDVKLLNNDGVRMWCYREIKQIIKRYGLMVRFNMRSFLRVIAETGHSYAQSYMATCMEHDDFQVSKMWARKSYEQGDPRGAYVLAHLQRISDLRQYRPNDITAEGCIIANESWPDKGTCRMYLHKAAQMGNTVAMTEYCGLGHSMANHYEFILLDRATRDNHSISTFILYAKITVDKCLKNQITGRNTLFFRMAFTMSKILKRSFRLACPQLFNNVETHRYFKPLMELYSRWREEAIQTVKAWVCSARRLGICRDIRLLIAKETWALRFTVNYTGDLILSKNSDIKL